MRSERFCRSTYEVQMCFGEPSTLEYFTATTAAGEYRRAASGVAPPTAYTLSIVPKFAEWPNASSTAFGYATQASEEISGSLAIRARRSCTNRCVFCDVRLPTR